MNAEKISHWVSLIANLGVLVGIIFLIIEINQTNSLMQSEERYNRVLLALAGPDLVVENPHLATALRKRNSGEELSADESQILDAYWTGNFISWQWSWEELDSSDLPVTLFTNSLSKDDVRVSWERQREFLKPGFVKFMEDRLDGQ